MKKTLLPMFATASMIAAAILTMPLSVYFAQEPVAKTGAWTGLLVDQDCVTNTLSRYSQGTGKGAKRITGEGGSAYSDKTNVPSVPNGSDAGAPADQTRNNTSGAGSGAPTHSMALSKAVQRCGATTTTRSFALAGTGGLVLRLNDASALKAKTLLGDPESRNNPMQVRIRGSKKGDTIDAQSISPAQGNAKH